MADWVALLEAAYDVAADPQDWLRGLARTAEPLLDRGAGITAQIVRNRPEFVIEDVYVHSGRSTVSDIEGAISYADTEALATAFRSGISAGTVSEVVFSRVPGSADAFARATGGRFRDSFGIVAYTGLDRVVALNTPLERPYRMRSRERRLWTRVAAHVGAGYRLRAALGGPSATAEAVLTPEGRVLEATGPARSAAALERLRSAVQGVARARQLRGRDPYQATALWQALVAGRWSLIDRFDSGGRRYVAAVRNDPQLGDGRGLTARELQVADLIGLGRASKEIAYLLGITESAVNNSVARVRRKLGLTSRAELAAFFAQGGLRATLARLEVADHSFLTGSYGGVAQEKLDRLTPAEREIALLLVKGATNRAIATARGTSLNTVANQVKAVFAKLGVSNRAALATALSSAH